MQIVDLRSDTVTVPTPAMRDAMAQADVGDDVYGEDPTVNRLQEMAAEMLGHEAGLFVPTGTMGNLAAILAHCQRGDEVILGDKAHTFMYEAGGISALGGVHSCQLSNQPDGTLKLEDIQAAIRPDDAHAPISRLVCLENTHNRCGGSVLSTAYTSAVADLAHAHGLKLHLDGARIFNAAAALGVPVRELTEQVDSVTFCLSKALSAPVGSVVCGSREFIQKAHRARKILGGGMRQAGILAAAGIVALQTMAPRLAEDHQRARNLANRLAAIPGLYLTDGAPQSNMVYCALSAEVPLDARQVKAALDERGVKVGAVGARRFRLVTHYWIDDSGIDRTVAAFTEVLNQAPASSV
jgi:threonine aldolase